MRGDAVRSVAMARFLRPFSRHGGSLSTFILFEGISCPDWIIAQSFRDSQRRLTAPRGRLYNSGMLRRGHLAPRAGIQLAQKKQIFIRIKKQRRKSHGQGPY